MPRGTRRIKRKYGRKRSRSKRTKRKTVRGRKKSKKKKAAAKKKYKRKQKLINKVIRRVQTKLADEKASWKRTKLVTLMNGADQSLLDQSGVVTNGSYVHNLGGPHGLPFKYRNYFTIDQFHGKCVPRWEDSSNENGEVEDPNWEYNYYNQRYVPQEFIGIPAPTDKVHGQDLPIDPKMYHDMEHMADMVTQSRA